MKLCYFLFLLTLNIAVNAIEKSEDAKKTLEDIYKNKSGYAINNKEVELIKKHGGDSTYGEILTEGIDKIFNEINPNYNDVFVDLGSGIGKAPLYVYLTTPVKKSKGIELSATRAKLANAALAELKKQKKIDSNRPLILEEKDFLDSDISDATIAFINSLCYSEELLKKVLDKLANNKGIRLVSSKKFPEDGRFELKKELVVPMSWHKEGAPVYIYELK